MQLEALVSRKFQKYHAYVRKHKQLRDCTSLVECADMSRQVIDDYMDNRLIWEELNYYKEHRTLLGKHPAFAEFNRRKILLNFSIKELIGRQRQVLDNIWRIKSEMKKKDKPHLDVIRRERLTGYENELSDINRIIG